MEKKRIEQYKKYILNLLLANQKWQLLEALIACLNSHQRQNNNHDVSR